ncbi:MAG: hypothetical protein OXU61_12685 [Gammaproteobacteria bacterium]|nr:hypothetical protein [Gammaproteobacteria bacterium]
MAGKGGAPPARRPRQARSRARCQALLDVGQAFWPRHAGGGRSQWREGSAGGRGGQAPRGLARAEEAVRGKEELVAKYPRQAIAMCACEVLVGKTPYEAAIKAKKAHPDGASFTCTEPAFPGWSNGHPAPSRRRQVCGKVRPARQFRPGASRRGRLWLKRNVR